MLHKAEEPLRSFCIGRPCTKILIDSEFEKNTSIAKDVCDQEDQPSAAYICRHRQIARRQQQSIIAAVVYFDAKQFLAIGLPNDFSDCRLSGEAFPSQSRSRSRTTNFFVEY